MKKSTGKCQLRVAGWLGQQNRAVIVRDHDVSYQRGRGVALPAGRTQRRPGGQADRGERKHVTECLRCRWVDLRSYSLTGPLAAEPKVPFQSKTGELVKTLGSIKQVGTSLASFSLTSPACIPAMCIMGEPSFT